MADSIWARRVIAALFVAAMPIFLITASVTWAVNESRLYSYGFDKYNVSAATGIDREDLIQAGGEIRAYFNSNQEPLDVRAEVFGRERPLFGARETIHMRDVKGLIRGVYIIGAVTFAYLAAVTALGFRQLGRGFVAPLSRWVLWGGEATVGFVAAVGLVSLVAFDQLFLLFHRLSFANDFWQLDPSRHYLVVMFPEGFWLDATLFVGFATVGGAVALAGAAVGYRKWQARAEAGGAEEAAAEPTRQAEG